MTGHRRPALAPVLLIGGIAMLAACGDDAADTPSGVDVARLSAVQADPALTGGVTKSATAETGSSDSPYFRAQVVRAGGVETPAQLVAAARAAGWRVTSAVCRDAVAAAPGPAVSVQAFRTMPEPPAGGGAYTVGLRIEDGRAIAVVPYHLDAENPWNAPDIDLTPQQTCAESPGAPPTAGQPVEISTAAAPD